VKERLYAAFQGLIDNVLGALPRIAVGIVLFVLALLAARLLEKLLRLALIRMRLDNLMQTSGLDRTLQRIGIRQQLTQFLPRLAYYLILLLLVKTTADILGLVAISEALGSFFTYLPSLIAAFLLLAIGSAIAQFVGQTVKQAAENAGIEFANQLGRVVYGLLMFIIGVMAVAQLKIDTEMLRLVTSLVLAGAALAFGLSFGLGARDVIRSIIAGFYARQILEVGKSLQVAGSEGVLRSITATHAVLESNEQRISVSNSTFLDHVTRQPS
jgi:hypothetical protein